MTPDEPSNPALPGPTQPAPADTSVRPAPPDILSHPASTPLDMPRQVPPVLNVKSAAELEAAVKASAGPIVVDFVQEGCGACDEATLDELATGCAGKATFIRADVTKGDLDTIAEKFNVEGTPTTLFAKSSKDWAPSRAQEVDASDPALKRKLKCALPQK
jgi:thiol-disulfide isomerase/thioredoxin